VGKEPAVSSLILKNLFIHALLLAYSVSGKSHLQFKLLNSLMIETKTYVNKMLTEIQYSQKNKMF